MHLFLITVMVLEFGIYAVVLVFGVVKQYQIFLQYATVVRILVR